MKKVYLAYDFDESVMAVFSRKTDAINFIIENHGDMSSENAMTYIGEFKLN